MHTSGASRREIAARCLNSVATRSACADAGSHFPILGTFETRRDVGAGSASPAALSPGDTHFGSEWLWTESRSLNGDTAAINQPLTEAADI